LFEALSFLEVPKVFWNETYKFVLHEEVKLVSVTLFKHMRELALLANESIEFAWICILVVIIEL